MSSVEDGHGAAAQDMTSEQVVAMVQSGQWGAIFHESMEAAGRKVDDFGWVDLSEGDSNPRPAPSLPGQPPKVILDLWFMAGRFPWAPALDEKTVRKSHDGLWYPAGTYQLKKVTVVVTVDVPTTMLLGPLHARRTQE